MAPDPRKALLWIKSALGLGIEYPDNGRGMFL